ncbi:hypothetical protein NECAME_01932 [Necator americanus]|uniref:RDD domain-containing protein n=1 Tax=Necator americanus TaxID=51031 RepID=W2TNQ7_NECAM|nr:hypothetical protein NECAME_01932 [Necator americanus]ETN82647.1 hypothetical protein NECAME_01932 [Necator americanus]
MSDPSSETQPTRDASEKEGSRPSITLGEYCEQLRKWMDEVNCWQAFHQYNTVMMAYQDQLHTRQGQSDRADGGLRRRRQEPEVDFVEQNDGGEVRRDPVLVLPVPPSARDVAVIHNPNGPDLLAAQFTVASYLRRFFAEVIDFVFAFFIKLLLVYYLVELELVDLSRFDKLLSNEADLQTLVDITQELFPLELLGKLACSLLEASLEDIHSEMVQIKLFLAVALCLSQSLFARFSGQTPGKYVMGVRVIECGSVTHVVGAPANVVRVTGSVLIPFKA